MMKFSDYKLEITLVFMVIAGIIGVIVWFILDYLAINNSIELAVITSITIIMLLITYLLHGKGLLPHPKKQFYSKNMSYNYMRKKIRKSNFVREKYLHFHVKKKKFKNS
jgi:low affinity Fe/Cu permease